MDNQQQDLPVPMVVREDMDFSVHFNPEQWEHGNQMTDDIMWEGCDWPEGSEYAGLGSEGVMEWPNEVTCFVS